MLNVKQEYIKCYQDKTRCYFIENYLSTFNAMERKEVPFILFPRQKVYLDSCANYSNTISIKHRQAGITTISAAWICGQCVFMKKGSPEIVLCIANKLDQAIELSNKIVNFLEQVPRWMWGSEYYSPDPESLKNKKSIFIKRNKNYVELFNGCKIYSRASSPNAARGISAVTILIIDECAFLSDHSSYSAAVAAQSTVANPKCLMVSTPNGKDQLYYKIYQQALKGENNYHIVEFKWFQDLRYNRNLKWFKKDPNTGVIDWDVDTVIDAKGNIVYDEERWRSLERKGWTPTSPWFENMCKSFNNDSQKIAQELLVSFLGSADNVVPVDVIEQQMNENVVKITEDWKLRDMLVRETWIWKDPVPTHRYIIAVDPSTGSGEDSSSIEVIDVDAVDEKGLPCVEQVLEYNGKMNGEEIASLVDRYGRVYNDALAVVECIGGYGDAVVLKLRDFYQYPNLYYDETTALKNYTTDYARKLFKAKDDDKLPGFRSNALRIQMISNFIEMLKNNAFKVRSERVISELDTWIFKNGRPDHMDGAHDDNLTCLAMGLFIMTYYMLRTDKIKQRDSYIVKSWMINNSNNTDYNTRHLEEKVNMSKQPKTINPFAMLHRTKSNDIVKACIMLAGFKVK